LNNEKKQTSDINTDECERFDWKSKYPIEARREMCVEMIYLGVIFLLSLVILLLNYMCLFASVFSLSGSSLIRFTYMVYFSAAGMLGGVIFGMKYFYRVVARGYWTQDRRYWRILSPFISMTIAFIVGAMASAGILSAQNSPTNTWAVVFGFLAGYFADQAVGKMYELATLVFGNTTKR
jgi:hypothetical protein